MKTLISLDVLEQAELVAYETGTEGEKDIFAYLTEMNNNGFTRCVLIGFSDDEAFTAKTGIKGKYAFDLAGISGRLGAPTVAQFAIRTGGLVITKDKSGKALVNLSP